MGTQTVLEQVPDLVEKAGVVFTDFLPWKRFRAGWAAFMSAVRYDEDKLAAHHTAPASTPAVRFFMCPDNVGLTSRLKGIFIRIAKAMFLFNKHILIIAGRHSKVSLGTLGNLQ